MSAPWLQEARWTALAVDLGSARTRVWAPGGGMVLDVPTVTFPDAGRGRGQGRGALHPVRRRAVDVAGTARTLGRMLRQGQPPLERPLVVLTAPVLDGVAYRAAARAAVEVLRPRAVLTVPTARAAAVAAREDLSRGASSWPAAARCAPSSSTVSRAGSTWPSRSHRHRTPRRCGAPPNSSDPPSAIRRPRATPACGFRSSVRPPPPGCGSGCGVVA